MPVVCESNLTNVLKMLKTQGVWIAGADRAGTHCLYDLDLTMPLAVVIGGEEKGIRPLVKKQCDFLVSIPQSGVIGSLNASAAAAVILYEAFRQRRSAGLCPAG
jgi:23S rRNA (guanosine2251-2'-O)-methyltransferase